VNDRPDEPDVSASEESPEIADVRRLLADARHTEPMPDDVAARMERLIDGLGDETPAGALAPHERNVIAIAPQRRRRAAGLLVAAAAIVVGGVVLSQNTDNGSSDSPASADAGADTAGGQAPERSQDFGNNPDTPTNAPTKVGKDDLEFLDGRVVVHPKRFSVDALQAQAFLARKPPAATTDRQDCGIARNSDDTVLPARYRSARAALVFRRPQGSSQVVFLYVCGIATPVKTTTLPAP
jgi:hypothetical protein